MNKLLLFTDGSLNPKLKVGYGAYLAISEEELSTGLHEFKETRIKVRRVEDTSSTKLELQTLLWALSETQGISKRIVVYTDSQNIIGLQERKEKLIQNEYRSGKNKLLNNHELYRQFYALMDELECELIKVKGHQPSAQKGDIDRLFTLVDRASRKALKNENLDSFADSQ